MLQLSAGFHALYSLFAWLTLVVLIAPPLAIPGVLESRPHSLGKALVAHGETAVDRHIAEHSVPYKHKTNPILHFIAVYRSLHLS